MNKVLNKKSTNKIYCLNLAAYNLAAYNLAAYNPIKTIRIKAFNKPYNKDFIAYNHFKGFKQAFNCNLYKSIKVVRFWLITMLKGFKMDINKIIRLKIYGWSFVEKMLLISNNKIILKMILISSFDWSKIWIKRYGRKSLN